MENYALQINHIELSLFVNHTCKLSRHIFNQINSVVVINKILNYRLTTPGLVRESGAIHKCLDEDVEGFLISDELHRMLLTEV